MSTLDDIRSRYAANFGATNQSGYKLPFQESKHAVGALLTVIDQQQAVIEAARTMAKTHPWEDEAMHKALYRLRGELHKYDALAALKDAHS